MTVPGGDDSGSARPSEVHDRTSLLAHHHEHRRVHLGRRLYDLGATSVTEVKLYGGAYTGPVFVLTHEPPETAPDPTVVFVSTGVEDAVAHARVAAGGKTS
jgi:hypothetical protein